MSGEAVFVNITDRFTATNEMVGLYMAEKNIGAIFPLTV